MFYSYKYTKDDVTYDLPVTFALGPNAYTIPVGYATTMTYVNISDVIVDEFYVAGDADLILPDSHGEPTQYTEETYTIPNDTYWDNDTIMHGNYNGTRGAGNIKFDLDKIQAIKLKKRIYGDLEWQTIYTRTLTQPVTKKDLDLVFMDYLEPGNTFIEYTYSVVINNIDHDSAYAQEEYINEFGLKAYRNQIYSKFSDYFIVGADYVKRGNNEDIHYTVYHALANPSTVPKYNRPSATIVSPGSKYPFVINNGISRYYSGTFSSLFFKIVDCCSIEDDGIYKLRNQIDEFLADGRAKLLKKFDGDIWLINVVGDINRNDEGNWNHMSQSFDWVEAGSPFSHEDLRRNSFILGK